MKRARKGPTELAAILDTNKQNITRWSNGERKLTVDWAKKIAPLLSTTPIALLLGSIDERPRSDFQLVENAVAVIGEVAAGVWREHDAIMQDTPEKIPMVPVMVGTLDGLFALRVRGNSMDKSIPDGFLVICRAMEFAPEPITGDLVIVERRQMQGGLREVTVKRFRKSKDGFELIPESSDPRWKPIKVRTSKPDPEMEIHLLGLVLLIANEPTRK